MDNLKINITYKKIKNLHLRVKNGEVYVSSPLRVSKQYIYSFVEKNKDFIYKQLETQKVRAIINEININDSINILGCNYQILSISTKKIKVTEHFIFVNEQYDIKKQIKSLFKERLYDYMVKLTALYFQQMGFKCKFPSIVIKDVKSKWGSYNKVKHEIIYSSNLLFKDLDTYEYIVVHELSHILEFNHSSKFYDIVRRFCPNYKSLKKKLKGM